MTVGQEHANATHGDADERRIDHNESSDQSQIERGSSDEAERATKNPEETMGGGDQDERSGQSRRLRAPTRAATRRAGRGPMYEEWSRQDLYEKAKELGIPRRSKMTKYQLANAVRNQSAS